MQVNFDHVTYGYDGKSVLRDFSCTLSAHGCTCFYGPSGCGKTTALRLLAGLEIPQSGRIWGMENQRIAYHFQENRLLPWYTVWQNIALVLKGREHETEKWLRAIDLEEDSRKMPGELSGGMQRRVSLARALAAESDVLLLDEPFRELDVRMQTQMIELVRQYRADRMMVLVTHERREAEALCDSMILFS